MGLYHTWHLDFIAVPPELWIIIMHFTTIVILSPLQRIGCDYHILLPHNCVIMTNESTLCAVFPPHSLFLPHMPVFTGSRSTIWLSFSLRLEPGCSWAELGSRSGSGWGVMHGWMEGGDGRGDRGQKKESHSTAKHFGCIAEKKKDRLRSSMYAWS